MSIVLENLRRDIRMRIDTDKQMSTAWIILPLLPVVAIVVYFLIFLAVLSNAFAATPPTGSTGAPPSFAFAFLGVVALFYLGLIVVAIVWIILLYRLVKRRNTHFTRQVFLYNDLITLAKEMGSKKGIDVALPLNNLDRTAREAQFDETEKSAALWAILPTFIGFLSYYVFYFLMKDFYKHERRQDIFFDDLSKLLMTAGIPLNLPARVYHIPDRSFILYLILTLVTGGIFAVYWIYTLITDPNNHFRHQALIEDTIMAQVTPQLS